MTDNESVKLDRRQLLVKPNSLVSYRGRDFRITNVISMTEAVGIDLETNRPSNLVIENLKPASSEKALAGILSKDDTEISDEHWQIALRRFEIIKPIIVNSCKAQVDAIAEQSGNHFTTIYNWLTAYRNAKSILALVPNKRGWKEKKSRLPLDIEKIMDKAIDDYFLTEQKPKVSQVVENIISICKKIGIDAPHPNTIRNRIKNISPYKKFRSQGEKGKARDQFDPAVLEFPGADYPLAYVQIDHTPFDVEVVDDEYRESIGRPFLTLAIDVFSRVVTGYYLSLDAPSALSVGMCITSSILPKNKLLTELNLTGTWDVWGVMDTMHSDNGSDFRVESLQRSCLKYGVHWEYRPIGGANFGGHIERLLGTINLQAHILPGTTFSNIKQKGSYDSSKHAAMSLSELERYVVKWITEVYHKKNHSKLDMPPIKKWEEGIWGTSSNAGTGLKPKVANADSLLIDFLPEYERSVQRNGVSIDGLQYYADCLRRWIGATVEGDEASKRKFTFKRDPRDVSRLWFFEPNVGEYYKIPTAKKEIPPISRREHMAVKKFMRSKNRDTSNQDEVYVSIFELRQMSIDSVVLTKKVRREKQAQKEHEKASKSFNAKPNADSSVSGKSPTASKDDLWDTPLVAFDDIR